MLAIATVTGCAAPRGGAAPRLAETPQPIATWYSVATTTTAGSSLARTLEHDFARMADLNINTVIVRHAYAHDLPSVYAAAERHGLHLIVSDPVARRYVRGTAKLAFSSSTLLPPSPLIHARFVGHVVDAFTWARVRRLAELGRRGRPTITTAAVVVADLSGTITPSNRTICIWADEAPTASPRAIPSSATGGIHTIVCRQHRKDELTAVRQWLAQFHNGLLRGRTGGVVFDSFRALPGNWSGIVRSDEAPSPERQAMIRRIAARVERWSGLLAGLNVDAVAPLRAQNALRIARFHDPKRAYLLIANPSPTAFVREVVVVPSYLGGKAIERAVHVPSAEDTLIGPVHRAQGGEMAIPVQLSPGEAALFELF